MRSTLTFCLLFLAVADVPAAGLDPAAVRRAAEYSADHRGTSFLAIQSGRTLLEEYPGRASADTPQRIYSGTKAFWNLAALAAEEDGILKLDERVADTIASWRQDPRKSQVTIRQLLDFSSGLAPGFSMQVNDYGNRDKAALRLPMVAEPGKAFIYGPGALQVFHQVLKDKLEGKTPTEYLERRVLRRMRLGPQRYLNDRAGNPLLAAGFVLTPRQWAKIGELVLREGKPVVRPQTLAQCWRGSPANPAFSLAGGTIVPRLTDGSLISKQCSVRNGRIKIGGTPVFAALRRAILSPASGRATSGFTSSPRSTWLSLGKVVVVDSPTRSSCVSFSASKTSRSQSGNPRIQEVDFSGIEAQAAVGGQGARA